MPRQCEMEASEKQSTRAGAGVAWVVTLLIALGLLAAHAYRYHPFFVDDALISLRYAERLIEGHGLTWTDGERVEGYSNLLWILGCAVLGLLGIDLIDAARVLGFLGMGAAIAALVRCHRPRGFRHSLPALAGGLGMALTAPLAVWTVGGLEQPLVAGLLAWALVLMLPLVERNSANPPSVSEILWPGLLFGLLCWTRPDGPLFIVSACGTLLVAGRLRGPGWRLALWLALPSVLFISLQLAFRLGYYGDWVPNTAHAKVAFTSHRFAAGLSYLWGGLVPLVGLAIPALAQLAIAALVRTERIRTLLWLAPLAVWSTWVIAIGGDIFLGWRHGVVVIVLLTFLAADFWRTLSDRTQGRGIIAVWAVAAMSLVILGDMQWRGNRRHQRIEWALMRARDGRTLGRLLGEAFAEERPLLAVAAAGRLPYYSKLPALDMLGLNDRYLALHPPPTLGRGFIGHELGDGDYFLRREPDLVVFCRPRGRARACSRGGREMQRDERFEREYRLVRFFVPNRTRPSGTVWVRERSPRIGVRVEEAGRRFVVPAYLFSDTPDSVAMLDEEGVISALVEEQHAARFDGLSIPPGHWEVFAEASTRVRISIRHHDSGEELVEGIDRVTLPLPGDSPTAIDLLLANEGEPATVRRLVLLRAASSGTRTPGYFTYPSDSSR